ncbi:MAG TPA: alpha-amylase family protein [Gammaproteobacteria bacterium]|nr:alpha-amylase family protein [Gammaproteobacteria bacterium]
MKQSRPGDYQEEWLDEATRSSFRRLMPRIEERYRERADPAEWEVLRERLERHFPRLFRLLHALYGDQYDFFYHLEAILASAVAMWLDRPDELRALDGLREADPTWYRSQRMVGATFYADLFAGDLATLRERIPYLSELGITYLHLMPLFRVPSGDNDGGYAVASYREVREDLGTMAELAELATELRHHGISLCLDFVFNHTADEHEWARRALAGDREAAGYYRIFPDREWPDAYERTMPEVFTDDHPGAFTYVPRLKRWVWTTFHTFQWDLNYGNPAVFNRMLEEMLFLANQGVEVARLDAVAFIWKRLGTNSQNQPEAHWIIQAFNALAAVVAPAMVFKSEAIVHPEEVRKYIGVEECPLSYNPQLMALLWDALATRDVTPLDTAMRRSFHLAEGCAWVNYVRCHDDIGWAFADEDIAAAGYDPTAHRRFLTEFYTGRFKGSFARGQAFQTERDTGIARISGTLASLAGVEKAREEGDEAERELAIGRILLLHGVIATIGGIPLIYMGDEIAMGNGYGYDGDPAKAGDTRWLHRAPFDWDRAEERHDAATVAGRVYQGILRLIQLRQQNPAFTNAETDFVATGNRHVFGYFRFNDAASVLVLASFSEHEQRLEARRLRQMGMRKTMVDLYAGRTLTATQELVMAPYQFMVLSRAG